MSALNLHKMDPEQISIPEEQTANIFIGTDGEIRVKDATGTVRVYTSRRPAITALELLLQTGILLCLIYLLTQ